MRIRNVIILVSLLCVAAVPASASAKPRLDKRFGLHHGYWLRHDGAWAGATGIAAPAGGTVLVTADDGRFTRIAANGKPDDGWGTGGVVDLGADGVRDWPYAGTGISATRWNGRYLLTAGAQKGAPPVFARVVDARGRRLPVTDAVTAALPSAVGENAWLDEALVPVPGGRLWDLRYVRTVAPPKFDQVYASSLSVLSAGGAPVAADRTVVGVHAPLRLETRPVPSRGGVILAIIDGGRVVVLRRLTSAGRLDGAFRPVRLSPLDSLTQLLPWRDGAIAVTEMGVVKWIDHDGRVVRQRRLDAGTRVAFDTARRLVAVSTTADRASVVVRRLLRNGTPDRGFGTLALRAAGRVVEGLGAVAGSGGRLLVVGRSVAVNENRGREDLEYLPLATVGWRITTR